MPNMTHSIAIRIRRRSLCLGPMTVVAALVLSVVTGDHCDALALSPEARYVSNDREPTEGSRTISLVEKWTLNAATAEQLIGVVSSAVSAPDGTVYLLDQQLSHILVYSGSGEYLRTLSREGEGPGELSSPHTILWLPGGSLGILDLSPGRITQIDPTGRPLDDIRLSTESGEPMTSAWLSQAQCSSWGIAVAGTRFALVDGSPRQERFLSLFSHAGQEICELASAPSGFDFAARSFDERIEVFVDRGSWSIGPMGRIYFAPTYDQYQMIVADPSGTVIEVIDREYVPRKRTELEKEALRARVTMSLGDESVGVSSTIDDHDPAIQLIERGPGGDMWVVNGGEAAGLPSNVGRAYDVFDSEGRFREVVYLACTLDQERDKLIRLDGDTWLLLKNIREAQRAMYGETQADDRTSEPDDCEFEITLFEASVVGSTSDESGHSSPEDPER